ncbi:MAG: fibronectin type III domain-containing protein [Candidatus Wallbacteria bacterium]|nr:fibronectin type III domain-containing protein [Candidatus Wallbacteria bacterium]
MFTLFEKRLIVSISLTALLGLIFMVVGCGTKDSSVLSYAMSDDGESPMAPELLSGNSEYLYNQEDSVDSSQKHFAVTVQWKAVDKNLKGVKKSNIIGYKVYRNQKTVAIGSTDYGVMLYEDYDYQNLKEGGTYTYYVSAIDSMMRESFSDPVKVTLKVNGVEPKAPENFYVIPAENKVAILCWDKPLNFDDCSAGADPICKFKVRRKEGGSTTWITIAHVPSDVFIYYDDTIMEGKTYSYRMYAVTTSGNVGPSSPERTISFTFGASEYLAPPTAPYITEVQPDNTSGIPNAKLIEWTVPSWDDSGTNGRNSASGVVAYRVYRAESVGVLNSTSEIENLTYQLIKVVPIQLKYIDTAVDTVNSNKVYYYRLSAINNKGLEGDMSVPAYYLGNSSTSTSCPQKFTCLVDKDGAVTFYFKYETGSPTFDEKKTYLLYRSLNKRYYTKVYEVPHTSLTLDSNTGEIYARFTLTEKMQNNDIFYFKLSGYNPDKTFRSNFTYYVKAEKFSLLKDNKYVLQAEDLLNSVKVRDVHYAWYANFLYPNSETGRNSLWDYDLNRGEHYTLATRGFSVSGKSGQALFFDPMGTQVPPRAKDPSDCWGASAGISNEVSYSTGDYVFCDLVTNEISIRGGWVYLEDTARPVVTAISRTYSGDSYAYNYVTAYNDCGYSYWQDLDYDGVEFEELYYRETQMPLLKHGMEGTELKLTYDVNPWTYRTPVSFANVYLGIDTASVIVHPLIPTDETQVDYTKGGGLYDFWPSVITDASGPKAWDKTDFDWNGGGGISGGCAYYKAPMSGTAIMARDYYADGHGDMTNFKITWRENYFGPLYSNSYPGYAGKWPTDAYSWVFRYPTDRPQRKDNCLSYDLQGNGIDYNSHEYIQQLDKNMYDMYQDQFMFSWNPPETGRFAINMYFYETPNSGTFLLIVKHRGNIIGAPSIINLSRNSDYQFNGTTVKVVGNFNDPEQPTDSPYDQADARDGHFEAYLEANYPIYFYFCPVGSNTDIFHDDTYDFSQGSPFEFYLDRIEFVRLDSN